MGEGGERGVGSDGGGGGGNNDLSQAQLQLGGLSLGDSIKDDSHDEEGSDGKKNGTTNGSSSGFLSWPLFSFGASAFSQSGGDKNKGEEVEDEEEQFAASEEEVEDEEEASEEEVENEEEELPAHGYIQYRQDEIGSYEETIVYEGYEI